MATGSISALREIVLANDAIELITISTPDGDRIFPPNASIAVLFSEKQSLKRYQEHLTQLKKQLSDKKTSIATTINTHQGFSLTACWLHSNLFCAVFRPDWLTTQLNAAVKQFLKQQPGITISGLVPTSESNAQASASPSNRTTQAQVYTRALPYPFHHWQIHYSLTPENHWSLSSENNASLYIVYLSILLPALIILLLLAIKLSRTHHREQQQARDKITFLAQLAHELRTPLTNFYLYTELIRHSESKADRHKYCDVLDTVSSRLQRTTDNALLLSETMQASKPVLSDASPNQIITDVIQGFVPRIHHEEIILDLQLNAGQPCKLDYQAVESILSNLIDNAIKYAPCSKVCIRSEYQASNLIISIHDTGPGIPTSKVNELFTPFQHSAIRKQGFGLGLSVCHRMVRRSGGHIAYDGNHGCNFTIWFPVQF
nr:HAMP domain-containing sensor histidine kinase [Oceanospirillum sediminis]